jgi:hypothetical protein
LNFFIFTNRILLRIHNFSLKTFVWFLFWKFIHFYIYIPLMQKLPCHGSRV